MAYTPMVVFYTIYTHCTCKSIAIGPINSLHLYLCRCAYVTRGHIARRKTERVDRTNIRTQCSEYNCNMRVFIVYRDPGPRPFLT